MDPIIGILFVVGVFWAGREAYKSMVSSATGTRAAARHGRKGRDASSAARRATFAWWVREISQGFPVGRAGWVKGWNEHGHAVKQHEHERLKQRASHATQQKGWAEAAREHWAVIKDANSPRDPPPPAEPAPSQNGQRPVTKQQPQQKGTTVSTPTSTAEVNYEQTIAWTETLKNITEQMDADKAISEATTMADQLGTALADDKAGISLAADLAAELQKLKDAQQSVAELASQLHDHVEKTHGPTHEAVADAGVLAERGFHNQ